MEYDTSSRQKAGQKTEKERNIHAIYSKAFIDEFGKVTSVFTRGRIK
jgi:hypothetical protein